MSFESLGLRADLLSRLKEADITKPTPIQLRAIPEALKGRDVMGLAQTGTGKTLAFGLPILQHLLQAQLEVTPKSADVLILAPTRELAAQIHDSLAAASKGLPIRLRLVMGGVSINPQIKRLEGGMHILVATPGRLLDLLDQKAVKIDKVRFLVLDEADQMLDLGFIHALRKIARLLPKKRQTQLFSATMPAQMSEIAAAYLTNPVRIEVTPPGRTADRIEQSVVFANSSEKADVLAGLLSEHRDELALVFARTKHGSDKLTRRLAQTGYAVAAIHGNKSQNQRVRALDAFRSGELKVLVATDVAARGIDIPDVRHVYNHDLPNVPETYVHRIGRTARAGREGRAVSICAPDERADLKAIEKLTGNRLRQEDAEPAALIARALTLRIAAEAEAGKQAANAPAGSGGTMEERRDGGGRNEGRRDEGRRDEGGRNGGARGRSQGGNRSGGAAAGAGGGGNRGRGGAGGGKPAATQAGAGNRNGQGKGAAAGSRPAGDEGGNRPAGANRRRRPRRNSAGSASG